MKKREDRKMTEVEGKHITIFNNRTSEETFANKDTSKTIPDDYSTGKISRR